MLQRIIESNRQNITTLTTLYVVLKDFINTREHQAVYRGLLVREINVGYRIVAKEYGITQKFYFAYVERRARENDFFVERNRKYLIREDLVSGKSIGEINDLCVQIIECIEQNNEIYSAFFQEIDVLLEENKPGNGFNYILGLFDERRFRNFGQVFEVLSFSILKEYFDSLGFGLKRFSVSYSSDGGMDFISANGIYQVTTMNSKNKIEGDLKKIPGTKKVLVLTNCTEINLTRYLGSTDVTEIITTEDLKNHFLGWLNNRDRLNTHHINSILIPFFQQSKPNWKEKQR